MNRINLETVYTDIAIEKSNKYNKTRINIDGYNYITIRFNDITDYNENKKIENKLIKNLNYILKENNIKDDDYGLIVGLGNINSTPDSLGPKVIENIIVTSHLFDLNVVEKGFRKISTFIPSVTSVTGIETYNLIKSIVKEVKPDFLIVIDSLKASKEDNLNKIIQITDKGISPGSGIKNNRKEISKNNMNIPVICIGVPTVININDLIVCNVNIDFFIDKISLLISNSINRCMHENVKNI